MCGTRIIHQNTHTHTHTPGALATSGWRASVCSVQCVGVGIHGTPDSITGSSWGDEWKSRGEEKGESVEEAGGESEGGREDLEEGEMRDKERITMKGGGDLKGEVFLLQPLTGHVNQPRSAPTSANTH